jgi:hypothetical protein
MGRDEHQLDALGHRGQRGEHRDQAGHDHRDPQRLAPEPPQDRPAEQPDHERPAGGDREDRELVAVHSASPAKR